MNSLNPHHQGSHSARLSSAPNPRQGKVRNYLDNPHLKHLLKGGLSVTLEEELTGAVEEEDTIIKVEVKERGIGLHPSNHPDNYSEYLKGVGSRKDQVLTFKKRVIVHQSPLVKACL